MLERPWHSEEVRDLLEEMESGLGYQFSDRELLLRALTHRSFMNEEACVERDNQRLEFLGDAVIGLVITGALYRRYPTYTEGQLSKLKAKLVCAETLAELARGLGLGGCLMLGKGEEASGGRRKSSLLADAYEATVAAIYLDGGFEVAKTFVLEQHAEALERISSPVVFQDAKSRLQELMQERSGRRPCYRIVEMCGPPHDRVFTAEVVLEDEVLGVGEGRSKKDAQRCAARQALSRLDIGPCRG